MNEKIERIRADNMGRIIASKRKSYSAKQLNEMLGESCMDVAYLLDELAATQPAVEAMHALSTALEKNEVEK